MGYEYYYVVHHKTRRDDHNSKMTANLAYTSNSKASRPPIDKLTEVPPLVLRANSGSQIVSKLWQVIILH